MRAGGCAVQLGLTLEAAGIVKQAVILARQRGHAQVTPLHVANTMLSASAGLFRAACLQSHSYPLQCKALELCFSVALNRLPTTPSSGPVLGSHQQYYYQHHRSPSLSNALIAAFKRAQAHQRRGSVESQQQQQQPVFTVKIELAQLIISILDDPSVSRVMREAGFSSAQVKGNVEKAVASEAHAPCNPNPSPARPKEGGVDAGQVTKTRPLLVDDEAVVETLASGRKGSVVVVGESLSTSEAVVRSLLDRVGKGEVPESLRSMQFRSLPLSSFEHMSREEVEQQLAGLKGLVRSCSEGQGVVLYLGDLKWAAGYGVKCGEKGRNLHCPLEHVIMELGRLVFDGNHEIEGRSGGQRFWLLGIATYQTYMMCREGQPSLETLWGGLHPLTFPAGGLELSLSYDR